MTWRRVSTRTQSCVCPSTVAPEMSGINWLSGLLNIECTLITCAGSSRCPVCCEFSSTFFTLTLQCVALRFLVIGGNRCMLQDKLSFLSFYSRKWKTKNKQLKLTPVLSKTWIIALRLHSKTFTGNKSLVQKQIIL